MRRSCVLLTAPTVAEEKTFEISDNLKLDFATKARANVSAAHSSQLASRYGNIASLFACRAEQQLYSFGEISSFSALAVARLKASWYRVGSSTGRSDGLWHRPLCARAVSDQSTALIPAINSRRLLQSPHRRAQESRTAPRDQAPLRPSCLWLTRPWWTAAPVNPLASRP